MNPRPPEITCLFFSDVTLPAFLRTPDGRALAGDLLIECSLQPSLGYALNLETPVNYPGVAGVLGGVDLGTLAHSTDALPAPIILAPGASVSAGALRSALAALARPDPRLKSLTLLVPLSDARALGAALAVAHRYAIAWHATAFPHEELVAFARFLAEEKLFTAENFAGFHPYAPASIDPAHVQKLATLLAPLSTRAPGYPVEITVVTG